MSAGAAPGCANAGAEGEERWKNQISQRRGMTGREKWYVGLSLTHLVGTRIAEMCERRKTGKRCWSFKELLAESRLVLRKDLQDGGAVAVL